MSTSTSPLPSTRRKERLQKKPDEVTETAGRPSFNSAFFVDWKENGELKAEVEALRVLKTKRMDNEKATAREHLLASRCEIKNLCIDAILPAWTSTDADVSSPSTLNDRIGPLVASIFVDAAAIATALQFDHDYFPDLNWANLCDEWKPKWLESEACWKAVRETEPRSFHCRPKVLRWTLAFLIRLDVLLSFLVDVVDETSNYVFEWKAIRDSFPNEYLFHPDSERLFHPHENPDDSDVWTSYSATGLYHHVVSFCQSSHVSTLPIWPPKATELLEEEDDDLPYLWTASDWEEYDHSVKPPYDAVFEGILELMHRLLSDGRKTKQAAVLVPSHPPKGATEGEEGAKLEEPSAPLFDNSTQTDAGGVRFTEGELNLIARQYHDSDALRDDGKVQDGNEGEDPGQGTDHEKGKGNDGEDRAQDGRRRKKRVSCKSTIVNKRKAASTPNLGKSASSEEKNYFPVHMDAGVEKDQDKLLVHTNDSTTTESRVVQQESVTEKSTARRSDRASKQAADQCHDGKIHRDLRALATVENGSVEQQSDDLKPPPAEHPWQQAGQATMRQQQQVSVKVSSQYTLLFREADSHGDLIFLSLLSNVCMKDRCG